MEQKINIAEILKDCPKGMELDCTMYDNVTFERFDVEQNRCYFKAGPADTFWTTCYGKINGSPFGKCVIFPKGKTTWEGFVPPYKFKDGDIVYVKTINHHEYILIFKEIKNDHIHKYVCFTYQRLSIDKCPVCLLAAAEIIRLATEEEKTKLFDAIKANGYKWNADTKTLERLVESSEGTLVQIDFTRELRIADEVEVILGDYEFVLKDGKTYFVKKKPQYPKTYEECCKILGIEDRENGYCGYEYELLGEFQKLYICRDAYWKIAGEQMGLGKPWKPDWNNVSDKHCIYFVSGEIWLTECQTRQCTLAFPTAEMRDAFYENFKELIDKCKELL